MKKSIIFGVVVIVPGLLIALGPQFLFKVCGHGEDGFPHCHWSAQAEIGMGLLITALGFCFIIFAHPKIQLGLTIGVFLTSIIALSIPHALIGGCGSMAMACRRTAFPAITAECVILLVLSAIMAVYMEMQKPPVNSPENLTDSP